MTTEERHNLTIILVVIFLVVFVALGVGGIVYKLNHQIIHTTESQ